MILTTLSTYMLKQLLIDSECEYVICNHCGDEIVNENEIVECLRCSIMENLKRDNDIEIVYHCQKCNDKLHKCIYCNMYCYSDMVETEMGYVCEDCLS